MASTDPQKDLSVLLIDKSQKGSFESGPSKSRTPMILIGAGIAVLLLAGFAISRVWANAPVVDVARPLLQQGTAAGNIVLTAGGYIVAHHPIDVSSKVVGKVVWVGIEKGDHVQEGQVLVRLDDSEFRAQLEQAQAALSVAQAHLRELENGSRPQEISASQAAVAQAQANFSNASLTLKRTEELFKQNITSQEQLDNARTQYNVAASQLKSAQENFSLVKQGPRQEEIDYARAQVAQAKASVDYYKTMLDATLIRAPITGTVLERLIERGEMVSTMNFGGTGGVKASVCSLADLNDLQVQLDINQNDFPKISQDQKCTLTADAYPNRVYDGRVEQISPEANRQKATIEVRVKVLKPDSYLRPEMNAHVNFLAPEQMTQGASREALTIPRDALVQKDGKTSVFVVSDSHAQLREVQLGNNFGDAVEVVDGIGPNDRVVVSGTDTLTPGQRVKVKGQ
jgi:HlyD family secretion protein